MNELDIIQFEYEMDMLLFKMKNRLIQSMIDELKAKVMPDEAIEAKAIQGDNPNGK